MFENLKVIGGGEEIWFALSLFKTALNCAKFWMIRIQRQKGAWIVCLYDAMDEEKRDASRYQPTPVQWRWWSRFLVDLVPTKNHLVELDFFSPWWRPPAGLMLGRFKAGSYIVASCTDQPNAAKQETHCCIQIRGCFVSSSKNQLF